MTILPKTLPNNLEIEIALLGSLLLHPEDFLDVEKIITSHSFFDTKHKLIFAAMVGLEKQKTPIDLITITHEFEKTSTLLDAGGAQYLTELVSRTLTKQNVKHYARLIQQKFARRQLI